MIYHPSLLKYYLETITRFKGQDILKEGDGEPTDVTIAITRCVEWGLKTELQILLSYLDKLTENPNFNMLLRYANLECYLIARKKVHGF